ncbi:MAG: type II toxin-antitoxin system VapC family toxin [Thiothrix sp.]|nr:MAG: type II toxin-antitoxin system VapC family toxin [Thiothrix sp.]
MGVVVDTHVFIDAENHRLHLDELRAFQEIPVYMAAVTAAELLTGVHLAEDTELRVHRLSFVENILENVPVLKFDLEVARTYSELYADALRNASRKNLNAHDLQIAATAICYAMTIPY